VIWAHSNNGNRFHAFPIDPPGGGYWKRHKALCGRTLDVISGLLRGQLADLDSPDCARCRRKARSSPEGT